MASTISHSRLIVAKPSYATRRAHERSERIARARHNLHACRALAGSTLAPSPKPPRDRVSGAFGLALGVAVVGHLGVAYAASLQAPRAPTTVARRVPVQIAAAPIPQPAAETPAPTPVPRPMEPPRALRPRATPKAEPPVPKPVAAPAPVPVAIVGLTLESTSSTTSGAAFAVGQTLSGSTERVARDPQPSVPVHAPAPAAPQPASRNRVAAPRAAEGVRVEPAKRLSRIEPSYPPLLARQRIEADVTVRVQIEPDGRVTNMELVRGAAEPAFNDAALAAAHKERFSPETHDKKPVATSLIYTYRFRITP